MPKREFQVRTQNRSEMVEITHEVQALVRDMKLDSGTIVVFVPHTTAGICINENADPDVVHDMLKQLDVMVPWEQSFYQHAEGNSAAHVKAAMMGSSVTVFVEDGKLELGMWQGIWFGEFDGPRTREVWVRGGSGV